VLDVDDLYRRYGPMVLRRCERLLRDPEKAVDAMHDVFVEVLRRRDRLDPASGSSLLYRTATNLCLNRLRAARRAPQDADEALLLALASSDERGWARLLLDKLLGREGLTREIAVLHLLDGLTHEEVARTVGMSVSGVRKRLRKLHAAAEAL
jgi:RNA polymerase sigma-70 factor (ECF subfamily)